MTILQMVALPTGCYLIQSLPFYPNLALKEENNSVIAHENRQKMAPDVRQPSVPMAFLQVCAACVWNEWAVTLRRYTVLLSFAFHWKSFYRVFLAQHVRLYCAIWMENTIISLHTHHAAIMRHPREEMNFPWVHYVYFCWLIISVSKEPY